MYNRRNSNVMVSELEGKVKRIGDALSAYVPCGRDVGTYCMQRYIAGKKGPGANTLCCVTRGTDKPLDKQMQ